MALIAIADHVKLNGPGISRWMIDVVNRHVYRAQMADTKIQWASKVWNPNGQRWTGEWRFVPERLAEPLMWRKPCRIFVDPIRDLFDEAFTNEQIAAVFGVMAASPQHIFQVLTKRPKRMREWFEWIAEQAGTTNNGGAWCINHVDDQHPDVSPADRVYLGVPWPLPNVHLGVSVEDQDAANSRIADLLSTPAVVHWLNCEPLLGPLDLACLNDGSWYDREGATCYDALRGHAYYRDGEHGLSGGPRVSWVVVGCESGRGARPADAAWFHSIAEQCTEAETPLFVKQIMVDGELCHDAHRFPPGLQRQEFPVAEQR